ncbi:hypothetical protein B0O99DRAFT_627451 [Bisporella sp. PMI_857]|nr:hypothetical protein B0O99DRAFT_627451 [Bisporella sp. PMI_857]
MAPLDPIELAALVTTLESAGLRVSSAPPSKLNKKLIAKVSQGIHNIASTVAAIDTAITEATNNGTETFQKKESFLDIPTTIVFAFGCALALTAIASGIMSICDRLRETKQSENTIPTDKFSEELSGSVQRLYQRLYGINGPIDGLKITHSDIEGTRVIRIEHPLGIEKSICREVITPQPQSPLAPIAPRKQDPYNVKAKRNNSKFKAVLDRLRNSIKAASNNVDSLHHREVPNYDSDAGSSEYDPPTYHVLKKGSLIYTPPSSVEEEDLENIGSRNAGSQEGTQNLRYEIEGDRPTSSEERGKGCSVYIAGNENGRKHMRGKRGGKKHQKSQGKRVDLGLRNPGIADSKDEATGSSRQMSSTGGKQ